MVVRLAAIALLCACADPRGRCAIDADCAGGAQDSFCAGGICEGPPLGSIEPLGAVTFARAGAVRVRVHVQRAHGTPTARVVLGGTAVDAQPQTDGTLAADVPLTLAPAGVEGPVPFSVELRDDLGHVVALPGSVQVDDRAPRIAVDAASVPTSAVVRGASVTLRVTVEDFSPVTVAGATRSADGSFALPVDTRAMPGASALDVAIVATDSVGNAATVHATVPVTRLKFVVREAANKSIASLVLSDNLIWGEISQSEFWILNRATGAQVARSSTGGAAFPQLATDGSRLFFARSDNNLCRMGADGVVQVCKGAGATVTSGPVLQGTTAIVATTGSATASSRLIAMLDDGSATLTFSDALADFASNTPAIGPDGIVYAGAAQAIAADRCDALNWSVGRATTETSHYRGQPAFRGNGAVLLSNSIGAVDTFAFTDPIGSPAPSPTTTQVASGVQGITSPTIAADGTALLATDDRHLIALRPDNSVRWSILLPDAPTAPPSNGAGDLIYLGTLAGDVFALNLADGSTVWKYSAGAPIRGPLAPGCDGVLYAATDGAILALIIDAPGLANSPWPMASHDARGTGDARRPLRSSTGACLE